MPLRRHGAPHRGAGHLLRTSGRASCSGRTPGRRRPSRRGGRLCAAGDIDAARVQQREVNPLTECAEASLVPYDQDEGSFFKVYLSDTGLMFYKLAVNPRLWLESQGTAPVSSDFRGALAENSVMKALASNDLQTYYWVPPASWGGRGELDFLLQDDQARVIPVEVKSARNVRARTLSMFVERARAPYAVIFSEHVFWGRARREGRGDSHAPPVRGTLPRGRSRANRRLGARVLRVAVRSWTARRSRRARRTRRCVAMALGLGCAARRGLAVLPATPLALRDQSQEKESRPIFFCKAICIALGKQNWRGLPHTLRFGMQPT